MGLAISLVSAVPEKVWYHGQWCPSRGNNCTNTRLTDQKGCCIWYNEPQYLADIEEHLGVTIQQVRNRGYNNFITDLLFLRLIPISRLRLTSLMGRLCMVRRRSQKDQDILGIGHSWPAQWHCWHSWRLRLSTLSWITFTRRPGWVKILSIMVIVCDIYFQIWCLFSCFQKL